MKHAFIIILVVSLGVFGLKSMQDDPHLHQLMSTNPFPDVLQQHDDGAWALSDRTSLLDAIAHARSIEGVSYVLPDDVSNDIGSACSHGARVTLILAAPDYDSDITNANTATVSRLRSAGCNATTTPTAIHLKALIVDATAFLSDTNFSEAGFVLDTTDAGVISAITSTLRGSPERAGDFTTEKDDALALEAAALQQDHGPLCVSTESFGRSIVLDALEAYHAHVDLVVGASEEHDSASEHALLRSLPAFFSVRVSDANEKLVAGAPFSWLGSANQTAGVPQQWDWGLVTSSPALVAFARERCERDFTNGTPP